jgi:AbrB family looped-hinge helix DNA binding protein
MDGIGRAAPGRRGIGTAISLRLPDFQAFRQEAGTMEPSKVGKRGTVVIPAELRRRFGIEEGTLVIAEEREDGILIRPAVALPLEQRGTRRWQSVDSGHAGFILTPALLSF